MEENDIKSLTRVGKYLLLNLDAEGRLFGWFDGRPYRVFATSHANGLFTDDGVLQTLREYRMFNAILDEAKLEFFRAHVEATDKAWEEYVKICEETAATKDPRELKGIVKKANDALQAFIEKFKYSIDRKINEIQRNPLAAKREEDLCGLSREAGKPKLPTHEKGNVNEVTRKSKLPQKH